MLISSFYDVYSSLVLFHVCKILNCRASLKMLLSICLVIVEKNFEHGCDEVAFRMALSEKLPSYNSGENRSHRSILLILNKKIKKNTRNTLASLYHSKVRSIIKMGSHFSFAWVIEFSTISLVTTRT